ncbi:MAG: ribonuclease P [Candidatus Aenigmarchaeota archaeon]|nr:ribonuclease P [Candidatus Aenigmarchaeota archaeon]MCX8190937.1 ribonuclease P [Candidatus Aenigmarchaeota archaeon]MDW8160369.1 ribonuclease P [Candidatus Aenigmarchaeota archaeon]
MKRSGKRRPIWQKKIAKERIEILLNLAEKEIKKNPDRSRRYVELARTIGKRYNVRLTQTQKRKFCKKCNTILIPGYTMKTWLDSKNKTKVVKCLHCKNLYRKPYK